jgi:hypothetical protein
MFRIFKTIGNVIAVSVGRDVGVRVYDNVEAKGLPMIDSFEADGVSDFNHAMKAVFDKHGEKWLDKPDSNGLWWHAYYDEHGNWFCDIAAIDLVDEEISIIGADISFSFANKKFLGHKWQKVAEPIPFRREIDES